MTTRKSLAPDEIRAVRQLALDAAGTDGAAPLGEHVMLHLRSGGDRGAVHLLAADADGHVLGYAHLDLTDRVSGPSAELAVAPGARRRGVGTALLDTLIDLSADQPAPLRLWSHGSRAVAGRLASARGFRQVRVLWQMNVSLVAPIEPVSLPAGIRIRPFDVARDPGPWLALNARAMADLADQAGWTSADLAGRMAEPWFDPNGFLLAEAPGGLLVGFHWTKVHGHLPGHSHAHDPIGEVYVVGVDPSARGSGLGRALVLAGLHHLRAAGLTTALLYVDATNEPAIALYRSLGFTVADTDVMFAR